MELKEPHPSTGRRGADTEWLDGLSLTHVWWIKIQEGYLRREGSQPHTRAPSPGFQCQEEKSPQILVVKTSRDWIGCLYPKQFLLKNPHTDSPTHLFPVGSGTGRGAWKAPVVHREKLKCLATSQAEVIVPFLNLPPTRQASWCHIWDSINLADTTWPALEIQRLHPTQFMGPPQLLFHMNGCFTTS